MYYDEDEPDYRANIYHDEYADDTDYFSLVNDQYDIDPEPFEEDDNPED